MDSPAATSPSSFDEELADTFASSLTAVNMLYWMFASRVLYVMAALVLEKTSPSYRRTEKKRNLANYWLQLIVYTPMLGVLVWIAVVVHTSSSSSMIELSLQVFSHLCLFLLGMYSMELFIRGHLMDMALIVHHIILLVL